MSEDPQKKRSGRLAKYTTEKDRLEAQCEKTRARVQAHRERQRERLRAAEVPDQDNCHGQDVTDEPGLTALDSAGQVAASYANLDHDSIATAFTSCGNPQVEDDTEKDIQHHTKGKVYSQDDPVLDVEDILGTDTFFQSLHDYVKQWEDPTAAANASIDHAINKTDDNASGIATSYPIAITTTTTTIPIASTASQPTTAATNAAHLTVAIPSSSKSDWATFLTAGCDDGSPCSVQLHSLWLDQDDDGEEDDNYDDINNDSDRGGNNNKSDDEVVEGEGRNEGDMLECVKNIVDESTTIRLDYTTPITRKSAVSTWLKSDRKANAATTKLPRQLQSKQEPNTIMRVLREATSTLALKMYDKTLPREPLFSWLMDPF